MYKEFGFNMSDASMLKKTLTYDFIVFLIDL